ncbi:MAG: hypothetical protein ACREV1_03695 [Gammaproteobacteria bacterium]
MKHIQHAGKSSIGFWSGERVKPGRKHLVHEKGRSKILFTIVSQGATL